MKTENVKSRAFKAASGDLSPQNARNPWLCQWFQKREESVATLPEYNPKIEQSP